MCNWDFHHSIPNADDCFCAFELIAVCLVCWLVVASSSFMLVFSSKGQEGRRTCSWVPRVFDASLNVSSYLLFEMSDKIFMPYFKVICVLCMKFIVMV